MLHMMTWHDAQPANLMLTHTHTHGIDAELRKTACDGRLPPQILRAKVAIHKLRHRIDFDTHWLPSHCGARSNEEADSLAEMGSITAMKKRLEDPEKPSLRNPRFLAPPNVLKTHLTARAWIQVDRDWRNDNEMLRPRSGKNPLPLWEKGIQTAKVSLRADRITELIRDPNTHL